MKTIAALLFLTALGIVLVQPVLDARDGEPMPVKRKLASPAEPSGGDEGKGDDVEDVELTARYPKRCMRKTHEPPSGLVAARRGSIAEIGFPDRRPVARIEVSGDVAWSPSGTFLAERGGRVFDQGGGPQGALFFEPREWQWSPVADCALATTERGSLTFGIPGTNRKGIRLLNAPIVDFDLSPNGRKLAAVVEDGGLWIADLARGEVVQATGGPASVIGWFSNRSVLFSKSPGSGKLRFAIGSGKTAIVRGGSAGAALVRCPDRRLLVSGSPGVAPPLAALVALGGGMRRTVLAPPDGRVDGYSDATCLPDGSIVASTVVRREKGPLVLLEPDGAFVRTLSGGRTANPVWTAEGLMFVKFGKAGRGRLWLIRPGTDPLPTQYRVGAPTQYDWHVR